MTGSAVAESPPLPGGEAIRPAASAFGGGSTGPSAPAGPGRESLLEEALHAPVSIEQGPAMPGLFSFNAASAAWASAGAAGLVAGTATRPCVGCARISPCTATACGISPRAGRRVDPLRILLSCRRRHRAGEVVAAHIHGMPRSLIAPCLRSSAPLRPSDVHARFPGWLGIWPGATKPTAIPNPSRPGDTPCTLICPPASIRTACASTR